MTDRCLGWHLQIRLKNITRARLVMTASFNDDSRSKSRLSLLAVVVVVERKKKERFVCVKKAHHRIT